MREIRPALAALLGFFSVISCNAQAADASALSVAAVTIASQATPAPQTSTAKADSSKTTPAIKPVADPIAAAIAASPDGNAASDDDGDQPSIISIESPPPSAEPLLKAIDNIGDPKRDLWARIRAGFALSDLNTPLIQDNEKWYAARPDYVERMLDRSKRYLYYIVQEVERRGMPTEIALLPMIESAYNPKAYSRSHAAGIWQFVPATGRDYGLKQNFWVDNRRNVISATNAALDYLQRLHDMFGSWDLALAAYNWGEGSVSKAINRNAAKGLNTDYLSLNMPNETRQYVPRLLAVKNLIQHPQDFGVDLGVLPNTPYFAKIKLTKHIDVALAAKLADISLEEFTSLNPHYNRPVIQAQGPTTLLLPVDKAEDFAERLENYTKPLVSWKTISVKRGERLSAIANRHNISASRLQQINSLNLNKRGRLLANQVLLVPQSGGGHLQNIAYTEVKSSPVVERDEPKSYSVRRGDSLRSIAQRAGVTPTQLKTWNHLKSNRVALHQQLLLAAPTPAAVVAEKKSAHGKSKNSTRVARAKSRRYTVRRGDTLHSIAQHFDVELSDLLKWNKFSGRTPLRPGAKVIVSAKND